MWGTDNRQDYYIAGREKQVVARDEIEGICKCGYLNLIPTNDFEKHCGGLTVKRSKVKIVDENGKVCRIPGNIRHYYACNACVNNWK